MALEISVMACTSIIAAGKKDASKKDASIGAEILFMRVSLS